MEQDGSLLYNCSRIEDTLPESIKSPSIWSEIVVRKNSGKKTLIEGAEVREGDLGRNGKCIVSTVYLEGN